jgi:hypothetical protein
MVELIVVMFVSGLIPQTTAPDRDLVAWRVRVYAAKQVDKGTIRPALEVAGDLLASAGIVVSWRFCESPQACAIEEGAAPETAVVLSARGRQDGESCGVAAHGSRDTTGTVMVSVPCVEAFAFGLRRGLETRTNPLVATLRHDDLVGAAVAHEIGHLLSIRHAQNDVMPATLEAGDVIALRSRRLRFSPAEARTMRIAAQSALAERPQSTSGGPTVDSSASASAPSSADPSTDESITGVVAFFQPLLDGSAAAPFPGFRGDAFWSRCRTGVLASFPTATVLPPIANGLIRSHWPTSCARSANTFRFACS